MPSSPDGTVIVVSIAGSVVEGLLQASASSNNCFSADTFSLTFAMGSPPLGGVAFWSSLDDVYMEVAVHQRSSPLLIGLVSGMIDQMTIDPINATASIEGRDLSAFLVDTYRQQDFVNQTASEIVSAVALSHGLSNIVTATVGHVGRYYGDSYTKLSLGQYSQIRSDWDLVVQLAREIRFDAFVEGRTLFFQPAQKSIANGRIRLKDVMSMRVERNLTISRAGSVRMQSWSSPNHTSYQGKSGLSAGISSLGSFSTTGKDYLFSGSNLTSQQVGESADRYANEINRLRTVVRVEMPWNLDLSPRSLVGLETGCSRLDGLYRVDQIDRHFTARAGSNQVVRLSKM